MDFKYIIVFSCIILGAFLLFAEVARTDKSRLLLRILATISVVTCFSLFLIPIHYSVKTVGSENELNLLTDGAQVDSLRSINATKYSLDTTLFKQNKSLRVTYLPSLNYHLNAHREIEKINLYGYGLTDRELKGLKGHHIFFDPPATPPGIISASWQKKVGISNQLIVQGIYHNPRTKPVVLKFSGFGTTFDSVVVKANTKFNFSFESRPKQIGNAVFSLVALEDKDTLSVDPVPFEVISKLPIRVLILASSPDFEYKFLAQWLFKNKNSVAVRTRISKDKYSTSFLNSKSANLNYLTPTLLKSIDVVVSDEEEINPALFNAVNEGMGLIIRAEKLMLKNEDQPLQKDEKKKVTIATKLSGRGKVITTTLPATYELQLAGKQAEYERLWSLVFSKAIRKEIALTSFAKVPEWPVKGEQVSLLMSVADQKAPVLAIDGVNIAPRQNIVYPFMWDGVFWPTTSGWSTLSINKRLENIYIYKKSDWVALRSYEKMKATSNFVSEQRSVSLNATPVQVILTKELSKWWVFIGFLMAISFLWYEKRFLAAK
ncbi:MAG: hypothetical protein ACQUHE_06910 [Bacteroidia bacterium]